MFGEEAVGEGGGAGEFVGGVVGGGGAGNGVEPGGCFAGGVFAFVDEEHAFAVVSAAGGFEDDGPADAVGEVGEFVGGADLGPLWGGDVEVGHEFAHGEFVLGVAQGSGAGVEGDVFVFEGVEYVWGDVFVVEGDDVAVACEF